MPKYSRVVIPRGRTWTQAFLATPNNRLRHVWNFWLMELIFALFSPSRHLWHLIQILTFKRMCRGVSQVPRRLSREWTLRWKLMRRNTNRKINNNNNKKKTPEPVCIVVYDFYSFFFPSSFCCYEDAVNCSVHPPSDDTNPRSEDVKSSLSPRVFLLPCARAEQTLSS